MFFIGIFGISQKESKLSHIQTEICPECGSFGRFDVYMVYSCFSAFFIPLIRWGKKYYVQLSCCQSLYALREETGRAIEHGDKVIISQSDLTPILAGKKTKYCPNCHYELNDGFEYCPKCGTKL